jgi:hypothetical protein
MPFFMRQVILLKKTKSKPKLVGRERGKTGSSKKKP